MNRRTRLYRGAHDLPKVSNMAKLTWFVPAVSTDMISGSTSEVLLT